MSVYGVMVCAGSGTRMGTGGNKTLLMVGGVPSCVRAYSTLKAEMDGVVIVVRAGEEDDFSRAFAQYQLSPMAIIPGGQTRQQSVYRGLCALPEDADIVLVHDGARPLVSREIVRAVIASAKEHGAAVAAVHAVNTIKRAENGRVTETLIRDALWEIQTPQGFSCPLLRTAHERNPGECTDDAALVEKMGVPVYLVPGERRNFKLTTREDVLMANAFFPSVRVGQGIDAHRLVAGRPLILCGVTIPYEKGLDGHSDADVPLHALMDAMLGAAALPDIGVQFPDNDDRYLGASSVTLLKKTQDLLAQHGYCVQSLDITIVAQRPKLMPYIDTMRKTIAQALALDLSSVSVKATTTEHMGFEGRGEGISAQAVAVIENQFINEF